MLGAIPCGLGILLANMMGGNTELRAIPEDYTPKEWEYFPNPITRSVNGNMTRLASSLYLQKVEESRAISNLVCFRFIVKHLKIGYQELYEVSLHNNWETAKVVEMKQLKAEVKRQMALEGDYKVREDTEL